MLLKFSCLKYMHLFKDVTKNNIIELLFNYNNLLLLSILN